MLFRSHRERSNDWFWAIGLITIFASGVAVWFGNGLFAIFILISGASLILFTLKHPQNITYIIENKGLMMGKNLYPWKSIKSFNIKNNESESFAKLFIETSKYFLPIYTIPLPKELVDEIKKTLPEILPQSEIEESKSMLFMEKLGF